VHRSCLIGREGKGREEVEEEEEGESMKEVGGELVDGS
jgi:hypothetical protein